MPAKSNSFVAWVCTRVCRQGENTRPLGYNNSTTTARRGSHSTMPDLFGKRDGGPLNPFRYHDPRAPVLRHVPRRYGSSAAIKRRAKRRGSSRSSRWAHRIGLRDGRAGPHSRPDGTVRVVARDDELERHRAALRRRVIADFIDRWGVCEQGHVLTDLNRDGQGRCWCCSRGHERAFETPRRGIGQSE